MENILHRKEEKRGVKKSIIEKKYNKKKLKRI